jgi:UDP-N-acetylglucosamine--N-acetylmuramyl-(pentapeptide) pyrophosphoryl-undecaprenol N-acetylglucosamine transferase
VLRVHSDPAPEPDRRRPARIVIAGGYTGGHTFCALALAEGLRRRLPGVEILLAGASGGLEVQLAAAAGYPIATVWTSGIERALTARAIARNLLLPLKVLVSHVEARRILARFRPDAAVGVGGYASAAVLAEAQRAGIPTLIHEANVQPGITNRLLGWRADLICLGNAETRAAFHRSRTLVTGNPVRAAIAAPPPARTAARARLGLAPDRRTLLVLGGSLGASRLNAWVLAQQRRFAQHGLQVLWQAGRAHAALYHARLGAPEVLMVPFLDDMPAAYAAADLVVAAAGAFTLAELTCLGKPALIVPAREVSEDHQARNARELERRGAAVYLGADDGELFERAVALASDDVELRALGKRMLALGRPDATALIVAEVARLAGRTAAPVGAP